MEIIKIDSVERYNDLYHLPTLHPLVSVAKLKGVQRKTGHFKYNYGVYALFLKNLKCGEIMYGRQPYDYQEGTVTSFAPGQVVEFRVEENTPVDATGLIFHPDLIKGTQLGRDIKHYSFLSYSSNEALHLSEDEKTIFADCLGKISLELEHSTDNHSRKIIVRNIELLLDYCTRFYERQFFTRTKSNRDVLAKFETLLDDYFVNRRPLTDGLPTVKYFADRVFLSPNYFGDLIKKETGRTAQEYIKMKIIELAEQMLLGTEKTVNEISYELGFQYSQHFNRTFKNATGKTPNQYRKS